MTSKAEKFGAALAKAIKATTGITSAKLGGMMYRTNIRDVPRVEGLKRDDGWIDMQVQFLIDKKSAGADHVVGWTVLKPGARLTIGADAHSGEALDLVLLPIDGTTKQMAILERGRLESTFIDPAAPEAPPVVWQGSWRTLEPVWVFAPHWSNYADVWNLIDYPRLIFNTIAIAVIGTIGTVVSATIGPSVSEASAKNSVTGSSGSTSSASSRNATRSSSENIVALCDVDFENAAAVFKSQLGDHPMPVIENDSILMGYANVYGGYLHPVQEAWIEEQVPQCGICQFGMMIKITELLEHNPSPSDAQIKDALTTSGPSPHLCRCGSLAREANARVVARAELAEHEFDDDAGLQAQVIGETDVRVAVEAGVRQGWDRFIGNDGIFIGMSSFGASASLSCATRRRSAATTSTR